MRPMDHMSDRNGTPGFYENTLRHFTALSARSFGTKMETVGTKLERQPGRLEQRWREVTNGPRHALAPQAKYPNFVPTLFQLCPNCQKDRVFKIREFQGGFHCGRSYYGPWASLRVQLRSGDARFCSNFVPTLFQIPEGSCFQNT